MRDQCRIPTEVLLLQRRRGAPALILCHLRASIYDAGSPWQNAFVESFNSRARDELFARKIFDSILEAKVLYEDWRQAYNRHHPHSALGFQPPEVFAKTFNNPKLSLPLD